jgi:hypothetical protein
MRMTKLGALALLGGLLQSAAAPAQAPASLPSQTVLEAKDTVIINDPMPIEARATRPFHQVLNNHGYCCQSDINQIGCGSFWSQFTFMFGSCRTFFNESCAPKQPHPFRLLHNSPCSQR